ncbi:MAG: hypothetical protein KAJ29_05495 [Alphaproteobacteria bacterium]|nr:hypothetical protein [Alphaproteobacteria bacterium]
MSIEVETIVAVSVMMAVFSAVAAVGTSIVLGAGFERLRSGFEVIRKQTGFFSDAIHKLEEKMVEVDHQTDKVTKTISVVETKVSNVGEQANAFSQSMSKLEDKVDIVDKQAGFFGDAIHRLEEKIDRSSEHEEVIARRLEDQADTETISVGKTEALVSHAEALLHKVGSLASKISDDQKNHEEKINKIYEESKPSLESYAHYTHMPATDAGMHGGYN